MTQPRIIRLRNSNFRSGTMNAERLILAVSGWLFLCTQLEASEARHTLEPFRPTHRTPASPRSAATRSGREIKYH